MSPNIAMNSIGTAFITTLMLSSPSVSTGGEKNYSNIRRVDSSLSYLNNDDKIQVIQTQASNTANFSSVELDLILSMKGLNSLRNLPENWDGYGSLKPNQHAIYKASSLLGEMYRQINFAHLPWKSPHFSATENGDILLEWWDKNHKLSLYVGPRKSDFIKVWGPDIENEMEEGRFIASNVIPLWDWLRS
jgi:hypothetical protein